MVERQPAFSILQLVALSLPAFAILLQIVVESETPYTHLAVPITTGGMAMFLVGGAIIVGELMFTTPSLTATVALGVILLGILSLLVGASLIGLQTGEKQRRLRDDDDRPSPEADGTETYVSSRRIWYSSVLLRRITSADGYGAAVRTAFITAAGPHTGSVGPCGWSVPPTVIERHRDG